jgi:predicted aminopeptidase
VKVLRRKPSNSWGRLAPRFRLRRTLLLGAILLPSALLLFSCSGCSPVYVARAGWAEMKILAARQPLDRVIDDPATDEATRSKLILAQQAREFAIHALELDAGKSYTSFTRLKTDTLALVLSAAYRDRLQFRTWWFPVVGHVPYRGFFSRAAAEKAQASLEAEGFDTFLRPTAAFSTLGFFADPLLSTLLRYDSVDFVETILHELAHNHLFVRSHVRFNESFATFVGRVGAIQFFCGSKMGASDGAAQAAGSGTLASGPEVATFHGAVPAPDPALGAPDPEKCQLARDRWTAYQEFSAFLDGFILALEAVYARTNLSSQEKIAVREELFVETRDAYLVDGTPPPDANPLILGFLGRPLNNAILLSRMLYFHRLPDFQALLDRYDGHLPAAIAFLEEGVESVDDPFHLLPGE